MAFMKDQQLKAHLDDQTEPLRVFSYRNFPGIFKKYGIYVLINIIVFIHEISYKKPNYVKVISERFDFKADLFDITPDINLNMVFIFFQETFMNRIFIFGFLFFVWINLKNYPRIQKLCLHSIFLNVAGLANPNLKFPYDSLSSTTFYGSLVASLASVFLLNDDIIKKKRYQNPNLIKTVVKSIIAGISIFALWKISEINRLIPFSAPVVQYLRDKPDILQKFTKFCTETHFNISDIHVFNSTHPFSIVTFSLFFKNYVFIAKESVDNQNYDVISILYHEIAHTYLMENILRYLIFCLISFLIFFFIDHKIRPNLNSNDVYKFIEIGMGLSVFMKIIEYSLNVISCIFEERCDGYAISTPENAFNLLKYLVFKAIFDIGQFKLNFRTSAFAHRSPSFFDLHPASLDRILRIAKKYPEIFKIELNYNK